MQEKSPDLSIIKQNILSFLDLKGTSQYQFYKESGVSRGILTHKGGLGEDNITKFLAYAPEVNGHWLLTGEGPMFRAKAEKVESGNHPMLPSSVPLIDADVAAGFSSGSFRISENDILGNYVIPDFRDVQFMIRVRGNSMFPRFSSGDVIACRVLRNPKFIQWNKAYVIATRDQGLLIKLLKPGSDDKHYSCVSEHPDYDPFEIPISEVTGIAMVVGVVRIE